MEQEEWSWERRPSPSHPGLEQRKAQFPRDSQGCVCLRETTHSRQTDRARRPARRGQAQAVPGVLLVLPIAGREVGWSMLPVSAGDSARSPLPESVTERN